MTNQKENYDKQIRDLKRQLAHHQPYRKGTIIISIHIIYFIIITTILQ